MIATFSATGAKRRHLSYRRSANLAAGGINTPGRLARSTIQPTCPSNRVNPIIDPIFFKVTA